MGILASAGLAAAVSLDGFAAGMSFAAMGIRLRPGARLVIALMALAVNAVTMAAVRALGAPLPTRWATRLGGFLLLGLGLALALRRGGQDRDTSGRPGARRASAAPRGPGGEETLLDLPIRPLGLVVRILRHPPAADLDGSGEIRGLEVLWLGAALALDSAGAGAGAALAGLSLLWTPVLVAALNFAALLAGGWAGRRVHPGRLAQGPAGRWAPGAVLILLGLLAIVRA